MIMIDMCAISDQPKRCLWTLDQTKESKEPYCWENQKFKFKFEPQIESLQDLF